MPIGKDQLIAALLPDPARGWRIHRAEDESPLLALSTRQSRWERALFGGKLHLRGRTRYGLQCLFHVELLDFNTLAQCLDTAAHQLARRLEHHTGPVRAHTEVIILCDRALPDALERVEQPGRSAPVCAVAADLSTGEVFFSPGAKALGAQVQNALK